MQSRFRNFWTANWRATEKMIAILDLFTQEQPEVYALTDRSFLDKKVKRMYRRSYEERLSRFDRKNNKL